MRVLLTTDTIGGVWTFALELARSLKAEVILATLGREMNAAQREEAAAFHVEESSYKLEWMPEPWADVDRSGEWLLSLEQRFQPDVVHLNSLVNADLPWHAPVVITAHSCVLSWWEAVKGESVPPEWNEYQERVARSLAYAALVTVPSRFMAQAIRRHYGFYGTVHIIPNGRSPESFFSAVKEPFILAAGRVWDEAKNLSALERMAPALSWPVRIAGEGSSLGSLAPAELAQWYARASIYAWPALYEPFGLSVLEAALSGCALVLNDLPSLREHWEGAAAFAEPHTFAAVLQNIIENENLRLELAQAARLRAKKFTSQRMGVSYQGAYRQAQRTVDLCAS
jgi:glycogen synthase